jgi:hypothetical protein
MEFTVPFGAEDHRSEETSGIYLGHRLRIFKIFKDILIQSHISKCSPEDLRISRVQLELPSAGLPFRRSVIVLGWYWYSVQQKSAKDSEKIAGNGLVLIEFYEHLKSKS